MMKVAIIGSAALGVIAVAVLAAPSLAQERERVEEKVERKVIRHVHKDGKAHAMAHGERGFAMSSCTGEKAESNIVVGDGEDQHRTHIVVCEKEGSGNANAKLAEALAKARDRIGEHDEMSEERRAELRAAIEAEIARVRGRN